ncbi:MAG: UDP-N-acetylglucosamine 2-epimerase (non-hydrolyzing) [Planctomycetota bacterium]
MSVPPPLHVLSVFGARPQFVKAAVVSRALAAANARAGHAIVRETSIHTGQHWDHGMSQVFFDEMEIPAPTVNLGIGGGGHGAMTGRMLEALEREMLERRPDLVLVYGDTNSTLAAALAAAKLNVPVAHVEAGLRSFNRRMPEEINRVLVDHVAGLLFCPSRNAADQLAREGIVRGVSVTGDVMVDAQLHYAARAIRPSIDGPFALATLHRAENTDDPARLRSIVGALRECPIPVVLPVHPRTRQALERLGDPASGGSLRLVEPLSYFEMLGHLAAARFVVTDSGGLQKEAYVAGRRCLTLRDETEWVELVECGANRLCGADAVAIRSAFAWADAPLSSTSPIYGDGRAGDAIVARLLDRGAESTS